MSGRSWSEILDCSWPYSLSFCDFSAEPWYNGDVRLDFGGEEGIVTGRRFEKGASFNTGAVQARSWTEERDGRATKAVCTDLTSY